MSGALSGRAVQGASPLQACGPETDNDIELAPEAIRSAFSAISGLVADRIIEPPGRTRSRASAADMEAMLPARPPSRGGGIEALQTLVTDGLFAHVREYRHPRHYGHQRPSPLAASAIADLAAQALNPTVTMYEGGLFSVVVERRVLDWLSGLAGFGDGSAGSFVNGGAEGILTALLCARQRTGPGAILASADAHYAVARAAHVLGLPSEALVRVPTGRDGAIDLGGLRAAADAVRQQGGRVMAMVATAGTTARGAFDDLRACGDVARACGAWFHVDGAHGASALVAPGLRDLLAGLDAADSLTWNPHKLFWVAPPCAVLLVRSRKDLEDALSPGLDEASYVLPGGTELPSNPNRHPDEPLRWTLACTRYFSAFRVCACLLVYGTDGLASRIGEAHRLARHLHGLVEEADDFESLGPPQLNIVCFRYVGERSDATSPDAMNRAIRDAIAEGDEAYLTGVVSAQCYWLRAQVMSSLISERSNRELLDIVRATGADLLGRGPAAQRHGGDR